MGKRKIYQMIMLAISVTLTGLLSACGITIRDPNKVSDVDYTVVETEEVPLSLAEQIDRKKDEPFHIAYEDGEYLYLAAGYGEQPTGGYSIQVLECYTSTDTIYIDTELIGPQKGETIREAPTYPSIVVKMEYRDAEVVFR